MLKNIIAYLKSNSKSDNSFYKIVRKDVSLMNQIYEETSFLISKATLPERIWCIENDISEYPNKCLICNKIIISWDKHLKYRNFCSSQCSNKSLESKAKNSACVKKRMSLKTKKEKEISKLKREQTNLDKFGVMYPLQSIEKIKQCQQTNLERYGATSPAKKLEIQQKIADTNIERYGVKAPVQNPEVFMKMTSTNIERYGVENIYQNEEIKEKIKQTNIERYGVEHPLQSEEIHEKVRQTNQVRYGCDYPMQNAEVHNRVLESLYQSKEYILPSGRVVYVQGYEPRVIDELLKTSAETDIIIDDIEIENEIGKLEYFWEGKTRRYYPDIYIKSENLIIEVKSTYTMKADYEKNLAKQQCCVERGLNFKFEIIS